MRGWLPFYRTSWRLGLEGMARRGALREALTRLAIPLDPSRYLEFPDVVRELGAVRGDRVLDLASPKLVAVELARRGADVTSVDVLEREVARWRCLTEGRRRLRFAVADGRALPFADASFDRAYSISVLEHVPGKGDLQALRELARVVRPGGRVVITVPYAGRYREDWRDEPMYGAQEPVNGRYFFERWYDDARLDELARAAPGVRLVGTRISRMSPNWHLLYLRTFPWLLPLGPLFGVLAHEREGPPGDVARLTLERTAP
jgi:SAM-dependent methyltransferase